MTFATATSARAIDAARAADEAMAAMGEGFANAGRGAVKQAKADRASIDNFANAMLHIGENIPCNKERTAITKSPRRWHLDIDQSGVVTIRRSGVPADGTLPVITCRSQREAQTLLVLVCSLSHDGPGERVYHIPHFSGSVRELSEGGDVYDRFKRGLDHMRRPANQPTAHRQFT